MDNFLEFSFIILTIYLIISFLLYFLQDYFLFKPEKLAKDFEFKYENQKFEEYDLTLEDGTFLHGLRFISENPKGIVFYLKGNSKSIKGWGKFAIDFTSKGYDVIMVDYRGFGKSRGKRTQKNILNDLQLIYNKIKDQVDEKHIILYGRSLGSGFATKLASINNPKLLILDAPYYSMKHITSRFIPFFPLSILLRYPIPTYKWIKYVKCQIHIIHGTKDFLIPFSSAIKLSQINLTNTRLHPIVGGGHKIILKFIMKF